MFPTALAFIAATVGGVPSRGYDSPSSVSTGGLSSNTRDDAAAAGVRSMSEASVRVAIGATAGGQKGRQDIPAEQAVLVPGTIPSMNAGRLFSSAETAGCGDGSPAGPSCRVDGTAPQTERRRQRQRGQSLHGAASLAVEAGGKCLVVCPTGAEASVIVCLAALVAFFPPSQADAAVDDRLSILAGGTGTRAPFATTGVRVSPTASAARFVAACGLGTEQESEATAQDSAGGDARVYAVVGSKDLPSAEQSVVIPLGSSEPPSAAEVSIKFGDGSRPAVGDGGSACASSVRENNGVSALPLASRRSGVVGKRASVSVTVDEEEQGCGKLGGGAFSVSARGERWGSGVTKAEVRWRFLLLQQEYPWARPPRRLMQELNEYFMTPGEHSWWTLRDSLVGRDRDRDTC